MADLAARVHALLFSEGGSLPRKKLASLLECTDSEISEALTTLSTWIEGSGLSLITTDTEASLAVSSETAESVKKAFEKELGREIGDAGLEVLAIVLYRGPSTRSQIDYIRGVNTASTLRNLLARGLLERMGNPEDAREYLYRPTVELLAHLGVSDTKQLPDHATIAGELAAFESKQKESDHGDTE
ncbi:MAG: SMC-Scp complex subunit ScpB [Candidatus Kaiserbacteria bacterium]|nr:MAG: SMC-Scp complex subunit ScpB [Candidatus Kaiserbacteria bacterium]